MNNSGRKPSLIPVECINGGDDIASIWRSSPSPHVTVTKEVDFVGYYVLKRIEVLLPLELLIIVNEKPIVNEIGYNLRQLLRFGPV